MADITGSDDRAWAAYLADSKSFDDDRIARLTRSERRAWRVAIVAVACVVALCLALAGLAPLKTVMPPVVVQVDQASGVVDVLTTVNGMKQVAPGEPEQKYWLAQYVEAREGYTWTDRQLFFRRVSLMSDVAEQNRYANYVNASNPDAPQRKFGTNAIVDIRIRSISLTGGNSAAVRYERIVRSSDGRESMSRWVATMAFSFIEAPMSESDRLINPRGFTVRDYRLDEETR